MGRSRTILLCLCLGLLCFAMPTSAATPLEEAQKLHDQGDQHLEDYELKKALASYQKALALFQKNDGALVEQAKSLIQIAVVHRELQGYPKAQAALKQAEGLLAAKPDRNLQMEIEWERGLIEYESGRYAASMKFFEKATKLAKHPEADMLSRILLITDAAMVELEAGHYPRAKVWLDEASALLKKHPEHAAEVESEIANNLGFYYMDIGQYKLAEEAYLKALDGYREYYGQHHPRTTIPRANLAVLYETLGNFKKAETQFKLNLEISTLRIGADHHLTAIDMANLARIHQATGKMDEAKRLYLRCLEIDRKQLGADHPYVIVDHNNLAQLYQELDEPNQAETHLLAALKLIKQRNDPPDTTHTATLDNLAANHVLQGNLKKARDIYKQTLALHARLHTGHTLEATRVMRELALLEHDLGNPAQAREWARSKWAIERQLTEEVFSFSSEKERFDFLERTDPLHPLISLGTGADIAELVLHQKGRVLDSLAAAQRQARLSARPELKKNIEQIEAATAQLIGLQLQKALAKDAKTLNPLWLQVFKQKQILNGLQKALARHTRQARTEYRVADLLKALPPGTTLVEFVQHQTYQGRNAFGEQWHNQYSALVFTAGRAPRWVPIRRAAAINKLVENYNPTAPSSNADYEKVLRQLHRRLLQPVLDELPPTTDTLIFAAAGQLNFINFATVMTPDGKFLCENYQVLHIATGRDLLRPVRKPASDALIAFANPQFKPGQPAGGGKTRAGDLQSLSLPPLPGTLRESEFLRQSAQGWKLKPSIFTGAAATEAQLHAVRQPHILHLATHGFFVNATKPKNKNPSKEISKTGGRTRAGGILPKSLLNSGLALAGADRTLTEWKAGRIPATTTDGIVTAAEISLLHLEDNWLTVLSACETGMGRVHSGEGVMGLRRAFVQAGTQNLLFTLWPISDAVTAKIMEDFYQRALRTRRAPRSLCNTQRDWLVKLRSTEGTKAAVQLAGPFVLTFQGPPVP